MADSLRIHKTAPDAAMTLLDRLRRLLGRPASERPPENESQDARPADPQFSAPVCRSRAPSDQVGVILLYHRIATLVPDTHDLCVSPQDFRSHMTHLREAYHPMPLEALARAAVDGTIPERAVAVTLDDGYLDSLDAASPILDECGVPATVFVTTTAPDGSQEFWWDLLEQALLTEEPRAPMLDLPLDGAMVGLATATTAERQAAHRTVHEALLRASLPQREQLMAQVLRWAGEPRPARPSRRPMTEAEIARLDRKPGQSIGAHTVNHLLLPLQPADVQAREVRENKQALETLLGRRVTAFAYPYGGFDDTTVAIVRDASFDVAVTTEETVVRPGADPLRLPRFELKGDGHTFAETLCKIFADPVLVNR